MNAVTEFPRLVATPSPFDRFVAARQLMLRAFAGWHAADRPSDADLAVEAMATSNAIDSLAEILSAGMARP